MNRGGWKAGVGGREKKGELPLYIVERSKLQQGQTLQYCLLFCLFSRFFFYSTASIKVFLAYILGNNKNIETLILGSSLNFERVPLQSRFLFSLANTKKIS